MLNIKLTPSDTSMWSINNHGAEDDVLVKFPWPLGVDPVCMGDLVE